MGRKKKKAKDKVVVVSFSLDAEALKDLKAVTKWLGCNRSAAVRTMVRRYAIGIGIERLQKR